MDSDGISWWRVMSRSGTHSQHHTAVQAYSDLSNSSNQEYFPKPTSLLSANRSFSDSNTYIRRESYIETSRLPTFCYHNPGK